ncbi:MAG: 4a-hydroxytetrahydrobiopterin dehydratase [Planctomycetota bacterium]
MEIYTAEQLTQKDCVACTGGETAYSLAEAESQLGLLDGWQLTHEGKRIRKDLEVKNFLAGLAYFEKVGALAEAEAHHPDLHLVGYKNVSIEIWTHTIDGLSENDFILAAKIDQITV